jgi:hypothetical protein
MSLKTAALIALLGVVVHFFMGLFMMAAGFLGPRFGLGIYLTQISWLFNTLIFNGCLILFLAVFYSKQQS